MASLHASLFPDDARAERVALSATRKRRLRQARWCARRVAQIDAGNGRRPSLGEAGLRSIRPEIFSFCPFHELYQIHSLQGEILCSTHSGTQLDLLIVDGNLRYGFEVKRAEAPLLTPSMRSTLETLKLDRLDVVHAGRVKRVKEFRRAPRAVQRACP
jgi:hypothetical protein